MSNNYGINNTNQHIASSRLSTIYTQAQAQFLLLDEIISIDVEPQLINGITIPTPQGNQPLYNSSSLVYTKDQTRSNRIQAIAFVSIKDTNGNIVQSNQIPYVTFQNNTYDPTWGFVPIENIFMIYHDLSFNINISSIFNKIYTITVYILKQNNVIQNV